MAFKGRWPRRSADLAFSKLHNQVERAAGCTLDPKGLLWVARFDDCIVATVIGRVMILAHLRRDTVSIVKTGEIALLFVHDVTFIQKEGLARTGQRSLRAWLAHSDLIACRLAAQR